MYYDFFNTPRGRAWRGIWYIGSGMKDEVILYPPAVILRGCAQTNLSRENTSKKSTNQRWPQHGNFYLLPSHDHVWPCSWPCPSNRACPGCQPSSHSTGKLSSPRTGHIFASPSFHIILALPRPRRILPPIVFSSLSPSLPYSYSFSLILSSFILENRTHSLFFLILSFEATFRNQGYPPCILIHLDKTAFISSCW